MIENEGLLREVLAYIPSDDREVWWRVGAALWRAYGDDAFLLWDTWSRTSSRYKEPVARGQWRSFRNVQRVNLGTVFVLAKSYGWVQQGRAPSAPPLTAEVIEAERKREEEGRLQAIHAAQVADLWLREATFDTHPYLTAHGFPEEKGLVRDQHLLIPMRDLQTGRVRAVQQIAPNGKKRFMPRGCRSGGTGFTLGNRTARVWWCEGYATGLAVKRALERFYQPDQVVVAFSASEVEKARSGYVVADHDFWHCGRCKWKSPTQELVCPDCGYRRVTEPAGERAARRTGFPYWMPPEAGDDACDFMLKHGVDALADQLRALVREQF